MPVKIIQVTSAWKGLELIIADILDRFEIGRHSCIEFGVELLRYFTVERLVLAEGAFENGYYLYNVNLLKEHKYDQGIRALFPDSKFHYSSNFVTINLRALGQEFLNT